MQTDLYEEITALVDGEITDDQKVRELSELLDLDENLAFEKYIQSTVKSVCRKKVKHVKAPQFLADSIRNKILNS